MRDFIKGGPNPAAITLQCGPLDMVFEPATAFLRYIRLGDYELLRGIYAAVRDHNWDTIEARVSKQRIVFENNGLLLTFTVRHLDIDRNIDFSWNGTIACASDGTITFDMDGMARTTFLRNRIGFCVLHPHTCAGRACVVETVEGTMEEGRFPSTIAPHQPFKSMRAISHEVAPGVNARVAFEGDVFEMEDQRNWTDASYKTYSTPVALPFPVEVPAGTRIHQRVSLSLQGESLDRFRPAETQEAVLIGLNPDSVSDLPAIGAGLSSLERPLDNKSIDRLQALHLAHLRVDLDLQSPYWRQTLVRADRQSRSLFTKLEAALFFSDAIDDELEELLDSLQQIKPNIARWLVYHVGEKSTSAACVETARAVLAGYSPGSPVVAGSNAYFTEINRERPQAEALDGICYSINPQVHTFDNRSLVETLAVQGIMVESAREIAGGRPIVVSPVTLKPRFNPNATGPDDEPSTGMLPPAVDPRQTTLFAAGWTMGSLKHLAESGVASVTYYETSGWRGLLESDTGSPFSMAFTSIPGSVFPMYHVFADVSKFRDGKIVRSRSSDALRIESCVLLKGSKGRILIANLQGEEADVCIQLPDGWRPVKLRTIDETNVLHAMQHPNDFRLNTETPIEASNGVIDLHLPSCAYVCIDFRI